VGYWSTIEVHVSVICTCLPTLPSLFRRKTADASRQNDLVVMPEPDVRTPHKPKNRDSDILPLLKVVNIHKHRISR
jgi:hypothetical protein